MFNFIKIRIAIFGIAIIIFGVIFTSWGFDHIGGLLNHPARAGLLLILFIQFIIFGFFIPLGWTTTRQHIPPVDNNTLIAFIGAMGVLLFLMISPFSDRQAWVPLPGGDILRYFGLSLFILGAFFSTWASIHLCQQLSLQVKNQQSYKLVTDGPFKYVRHPRDFGTILIFIGIPLIFLSGLGLFIAVLSVAGLFERISREEQMLQQQFKGEWLVYSKKTRCLIPWISILWHNKAHI
ncbi:isoprenylcysteine carboxylmethyltransferase family protein [Candidatus Parabeggiatoa sp. HSG14]|uniref:methyltransferase family protein n=1 Tax=Candidatus Parabeggiatoa sp. HSG14 TaxID=3055593 RepID=UPI0025A71403|nr:isoprenylcysteine carboxylmethyltransferase family protein [Thiotrichales bacterium HSG14]